MNGSALFGLAVLDIPAIARININLKEFVEDFEELSYIPLI